MGYDLEQGLVYVSPGFLYFKTLDTCPPARAFPDQFEVQVFRVPDAEAVVAGEVLGPVLLDFREVLRKVLLRINHETKFILFGGNSGVDGFMEMAVDQRECDEGLVVQMRQDLWNFEEEAGQCYRRRM